MNRREVLKAAVVGAVALTGTPAKSETHPISAASNNEPVRVCSPEASGGKYQYKETIDHPTHGKLLVYSCEIYDYPTVLDRDSFMPYRAITPIKIEDRIGLPFGFSVPYIVKLPNKILPDQTFQAVCIEEVYGLPESIPVKTMHS